MKQVLLGIVAVILVVVIYGVYQYYKPHKNIETAKEDITITAPNLFSEFTEHEAKANEAYLDKLILVSGIIDEISVDNSENVNVYLNVASDGFGSVSCIFDPDEGGKFLGLNYKVGSDVKIKGICTGYTMDVVINKCVIVN